jgi:hypothetical protein
MSALANLTVGNDNSTNNSNPTMASELYSVVPGKPTLLSIHTRTCYLTADHYQIR